MQVSIKRVNAIIKKDWKDLLKNSYILVTLLMPLAFAVYIGRSGTEVDYLSTYPINLALVIAGSFVQAAMVAEEKEKNTLRGLVLSPASTIEILIGKSGLTAITTTLVIIGCALLSEFTSSSTPLFIVSLLLGLIIYITIGTVLGLLSRTVMETSIIGMPVLIVFGMGSMIKTMTENEAVIKVIDFLPSERLNAIWLAGSDSTFNDILIHMLVLLIWVVIALATAIVIYRKRQFD